MTWGQVLDLVNTIVFYCILTLQHSRGDLCQIFQQGQMDLSSNGCYSAYAVKIEKGNAISRRKSAEKIYSQSVQFTVVVKWSEQPGVFILLWSVVFGCVPVWFSTTTSRSRNKQSKPTVEGIWSLFQIQWAFLRDWFKGLLKDKFKIYHICHIVPYAVTQIQIKCPNMI